MLGSVALDGAGAADQPDTELLDAELLAAELPSGFRDNLLALESS